MNTEEFPPVADGFEMVDLGWGHYPRVAKDGQVFGFDSPQKAGGKIRRWNRMLEELGDPGFFFSVFESEGWTVEYVGDAFGFCRTFQCGAHFTEHSESHNVLTGFIS